MTEHPTSPPAPEFPVEWEQARREAFLRGEVHFLSERPCSNDTNHRARYVAGAHSMPPCLECQLLRNPNARRSAGTVAALARLGIVLPEGSAPMGGAHAPAIRQRRIAPVQQGTLAQDMALIAPMVLHGSIEARAVGRFVPERDGVALELAESRSKALYALTIEDEVMYLGVTQSDLQTRCRYYAKPEKAKAESLTYTNWKIHRLIRAEIEAGRAVLLRIVDVPWARFSGLDYWPGVGIEHALIDEMCPPWNGESGQATRKARKAERAAELARAQRDGLPPVRGCK